MKEFPKEVRDGLKEIEEWEKGKRDLKTRNVLLGKPIKKKGKKK